MSTSTLWHSLAILSLPQAPKASAPPASTAVDLDPHLPTWERHPARKTAREAGGVDPAWAHSHLP